MDRHLQAHRRHTHHRRPRVREGLGGMGGRSRRQRTSRHRGSRDRRRWRTRHPALRGDPVRWRGSDDHRHLFRRVGLRAWWLVLRQQDPRVGRRGEALGRPPVTASVSHDMAFGTYEEALAMVGTRGEPRVAGTPVSAARIQMFAATVRDPNPGYWDEGFAARAWGALIAPPAMLMGWLISPPWDPSGARPQPSIAIRIPLPGTSFVNAMNEAEFVDPIREGDRLSVVEEVVSISPEKRT